MLYWPNTGVSYLLQSSTNLASGKWTNVINSVTMNAVTVSNTSPAEFFRLAEPMTTVLIPAGPFTMGDTLDGEADAIPVTATISAFYMETNLVTYSQWQAVYSFATISGYTFDNAGSGKGTNYPTQTVNWYDAVKWCNARSQQTGLTPVYYTDTNLTQIYTNGDVSPYVNWTAGGYRLPTEAEWEKAARGGLTGQRFPWGDTISESQANYSGCTNCYSFDLGPNGYNASFAISPYPYTSVVGYFGNNDYGLCDMAGNVSEWCWDWYATPYSGGPDPRGPISGIFRIVRGGDWGDDAGDATCAFRNGFSPSTTSYYLGFRCAKGL